MSFMAELRKADLARCALWHADGIHFRTLEGWFGAVAGETGEMLMAFGDEQGQRWIAEGVIEIVGEPGAVAKAKAAMIEARKAVLDELADVIIYLDLLAACAGHEVSDPGVRYAYELGPDVALPRAAAFVLVIGDTLHKMERTARDAIGSDGSQAELKQRLGMQINQAFAALSAAVSSLDGCSQLAVASKFNAVSERHGLPVKLGQKLTGGAWKAFISGAGDAPAGPASRKGDRPPAPVRGTDAPDGAEAK
jgi:NTP pyrophosphatase (non-canonical NTP hydrolase)